MFDILDKEKLTNNYKKKAVILLQDALLTPFILLPFKCNRKKFMSAFFPPILIYKKNLDYNWNEIK